VVSLLWDLMVKRAFLREILAKANLSEDIKRAGIVRVTESYLSGVDWASMFKDAKKIDIFFAYAKTWTNAHAHELEEVARRKNSRIQVVLPDPEDKLVVSELARRFGSKSEEIKKFIYETETRFKKLREFSATKKGGKVYIRFFRGTPQFAFYRFDDKIVLTLYSHERERAPTVPTFVIEKGGTMYGFVHKQLKAMTQSRKLTRKI
jgi:hypothetical protein